MNFCLQDFAKSFRRFSKTKIDHNSKTVDFSEKLLMDFYILNHAINLPKFCNKKVNIDAWNEKKRLKFSRPSCRVATARFGFRRPFRIGIYRETEVELKSQECEPITCTKRCFYTDGKLFTLHFLRDA